MAYPVAAYLFLASLFVPTAGIVLGVIYVLLPAQRSGEQAHAMEAKAHG